MVVRVDVAPQLLRWAVDRAGWDADTTHRHAPKFEEWAGGLVRPTLRQLEKFASDTHIPFGTLFLAEPPPEPAPIPDMRTVGNVAVARFSADLLDTIYLCMDRQDWYRGYAQAVGLTQPAFVGSASVHSPSPNVAAQIRDRLRFGIDERASFSSWAAALRGLLDRVEEAGVLVMVSGIVGANTHRTLNPQEFRGFALTDEFAPLIFVNGADTKAAQVFTLVHELAHIWLGHSALSDASMTATAGAEEELWCNQVAAEVLVPLADLRTQVASDTLIDCALLEHLARRYRVSTLVALKRVFDAGLLQWDQYRDKFTSERSRVMEMLASQRGNDGGGNYYYTQPIRLSRRFAQAVVASTREGTTTYREAYQLLGTRKHATFENLSVQLEGV